MMLRVIAKLDDVPIAVIGFEQVGLGASSHSSDMAHGIQRHQEKYRTRRFAHCVRRASSTLEF
jgi:hypothetical protein